MSSSENRPTSSETTAIDADQLRTLIDEEFGMQEVLPDGELVDRLGRLLYERRVRAQTAPDWEGRAAKAEGWTSAEEREQATASTGDDQPYAIIDCRTIVGNTPLFWMPNGNGYGSVVSEIGRYTKAEAFRKRDTDFPVPLKLVVEAARPRVDIQLLNRLLDRDGLKSPSMGWGHPPRCVDCERKAKIPRRR